MRDLVHECIELHINAEQVAVLRAAEELERELIEQFAKRAAKAER